LGQYMMHTSARAGPVDTCHPIWYTKVTVSGNDTLPAVILHS